MNIGLLNIRIIFQKCEVTMDDDGNHESSWSDYYTCAATASGQGGGEKDVVATTVEDTDIDFTIRYCKETAALDVTKYRILFQEEIYNIQSIDQMNFKKKSIKVHCTKVRR